MSFKRSLELKSDLEATELTKAMAGIGMNFAADSLPNPNIEATVFLASVEGMERHDLRTLGMLVSWLELHATWLNVDSLTRLVTRNAKARTLAFWSAVGKWREKDRRFSRLAMCYRGPRLDLLPIGTDFQIQRFGEDSRFQNGPLRVPATILRNRPGDVLAPRELVRRHQAYAWRVRMGPSYRADMWAQLEIDPSLTAAELARRTFGSFATAWQVKQDWELVRGEMKPMPGIPPATFEHSYRSSP